MKQLQTGVNTQQRVHPIRRAIRAVPGLRRVLLRLLRPVMPQVARLVRQLEAAGSYKGWYAAWQGTDERDDDAIRRIVGADAPAFIVALEEGAGPGPMLHSLAAQVAGRWLLVEPPDATSRAAELGGYVMHLRAGDRLARHALAEFSVAARGEAGPRPLIIFADEDIDGRSPWFKTAFDPDLLLQQAALGQAVAYDAGLLRRHGIEGLRGHALMLAAAQAARSEAGHRAIRHVPAVLLHRPRSERQPWRQDTDPTAVRAFLEGHGRGAMVVEDSAPVPRIRWPTKREPLVSAIVPTRNAAKLLSACIEGLLGRTEYPRLEVIICDNDSDEAEVLGKFREWSRDPRVRILPSPGAFNYSAINNRAAREAQGEVLLFLNNDTEVLHPDWLREMVSHAVRPEVGAVGARLLFPNGTIQHAGVVLGLGGVAGHDMLHERPSRHGPYDLLAVTRTVSAVTAACMAVRRRTFLAAGGFDEGDLRIAYNDVDFCLRLREAGFRNVVTPRATLLHKESATRGSDMRPENMARWNRERDAMLRRWGDVLRTDPYYSPALALDPPMRLPATPPRRLPPWWGRNAAAP